MMFNEETKHTTIYLSKAEQASFESNPAEHVIKKANEVNGNYDVLSIEEKAFIGAITAYVLFDGLNG